MTGSAAWALSHCCLPRGPGSLPASPAQRGALSARLCPPCCWFRQKGAAKCWFNCGLSCFCPPVHRKVSDVWDSGRNPSMYVLLPTWGEPLPKDGNPWSCPLPSSPSRKTTDALMPSSFSCFDCRSLVACYSFIISFKIVLVLLDFIHFNLRCES